MLERGTRVNDRIRDVKAFDEGGPFHPESNYLFGEGGGEKLAARYGVELLASMPLSMEIRSQSDAGRPIVVSDTESQLAMLYQQMARSVGARIARFAQAAQAMPKIVIED